MYCLNYVLLYLFLNGCLIHFNTYLFLHTFSVSFYIHALYYKMTKDKAHCLSNSLSLFVNMHNKAATNYDIHYCIILSVVN